MTQLTEPYTQIQKAAAWVVHAVTASGVVLGLMTPARSWVSDRRLHAIFDRVIAYLEQVLAGGVDDLAAGHRSGDAGHRWEGGGQAGQHPTYVGGVADARRPPRCRGADPVGVDGGGLGAAASIVGRGTGAVPEGAAGLVERFNEALASMREDGSIGAIQARHVSFRPATD